MLSPERNQISGGITYVATDDALIELPVRWARHPAQHIPSDTPFVLRKSLTGTGRFQAGDIKMDFGNPLSECIADARCKLEGDQLVVTHFDVYSNDQFDKALKPKVIFTIDAETNQLSSTMTLDELLTERVAAQERANLSGNAVIIRRDGHPDFSVIRLGFQGKNSTCIFDQIIFDRLSEDEFSFGLSHTPDIQSKVGTFVIGQYEMNWLAPFQNQRCMFWRFAPGQQYPSERIMYIEPYQDGLEMLMGGVRQTLTPDRSKTGVHYIVDGIPVETAVAWYQRERKGDDRSLFLDVDGMRHEIPYARYPGMTLPYQIMRGALENCSEFSLTFPNRGGKSSLYSYFDFMASVSPVMETEHLRVHWRKNAAGELRLAYLDYLDGDLANGKETLVLRSYGTEGHFSPLGPRELLQCAHRKYGCTAEKADLTIRFPAEDGTFFEYHLTPEFRMSSAAELIGSLMPTLSEYQIESKTRHQNFEVRTFGLQSYLPIEKGSREQHGICFYFRDGSLERKILTYPNGTERSLAVGDGDLKITGNMTSSTRISFIESMRLASKRRQLGDFKPVAQLLESTEDGLNTEIRTDPSSRRAVLGVTQSDQRAPLFLADEFRLMLPSIRTKNDWELALALQAQIAPSLPGYLFGRCLVNHLLALTRQREQKWPETWLSIGAGFGDLSQIVVEQQQRIEHLGLRRPHTTDLDQVEAALAFSPADRKFATALEGYQMDQRFGLVYCSSLHRFDSYALSRMAALVEVGGILVLKAENQLLTQAGCSFLSDHGFVFCEGPNACFTLNPSIRAQLDPSLRLKSDQALRSSIFLIARREQDMEIQPQSINDALVRYYPRDSLYEIGRTARELQTARTDEEVVRLVLGIAKHLQDIDPTDISTGSAGIVPLCRNVLGRAVPQTLLSKATNGNNQDHLLGLKDLIDTDLGDLTDMSDVISRFYLACSDIVSWGIERNARILTT